MEMRAPSPKEQMFNEQMHRWRVQNVPQLDSELSALRQRLATLEEQKRIETERALEKGAFPLKNLEEIIDAKRKQIESNSYSKSIPLARFYDQEKLAFLEPIFNMLKNIQERLDVLEKLIPAAHPQPSQPCR
jgi:hypothetical protein